MTCLKVRDKVFRESYHVVQKVRNKLRETHWQRNRKQLACSVLTRCKCLKTSYALNSIRDSLYQIICGISCVTFRRLINDRFPPSGTKM